MNPSYDEFLDNDPNNRQDVYNPDGMGWQETLEGSTNKIASMQDVGSDVFYMTWPTVAGRMSAFGLLFLNRIIEPSFACRL